MEYKELVDRDMVKREFDILHKEFLSGKYEEYEGCPSYRSTGELIVIYNVINMGTGNSITFEELIEEKGLEEK